jgi:hypothetical protein
VSGWKRGDPMPVQVHKQTDARGQILLWLPDGRYDVSAFTETDPVRSATLTVQVPAPRPKPTKRRRPVTQSVRLTLRDAPR